MCLDSGKAKAKADKVGKKSKTQDFIKLEELPKIKKKKAKMRVEIDLVSDDEQADDTASVASSCTSTVAQIKQQRESLIAALKEHQTQGLHPNINLLKVQDVKILFKDKKHGARKLQLNNPSLFKDRNRIQAGNSKNTGKIISLIFPVLRTYITPFSSNFRKKSSS